MHVNTDTCRRVGFFVVFVFFKGPSRWHADWKDPEKPAPNEWEGESPEGTRNIKESFLSPSYPQTDSFNPDFFLSLLHFLLAACISSTRLIVPLELSEDIVVKLTTHFLSPLVFKFYLN